MEILRFLVVLIGILAILVTLSNVLPNYFYWKKLRKQASVVKNYHADFGSWCREVLTYLYMACEGLEKMQKNEDLTKEETEYYHSFSTFLTSVDLNLAVKDIYMSFLTYKAYPASSTSVSPVEYVERVDCLLRRLNYYTKEFTASFESFNKQTEKGCSAPLFVFEADKKADVEIKYLPEIANVRNDIQKLTKHLNLLLEKRNQLDFPFEG
ncbi:MAG: hypothetical protein PHE89_06930 [Alphaproteobacteria bacterium]|nr:hypothetical protein [Alphaproteobacteria bacterium]